MGQATQDLALFSSQTMVECPGSLDYAAIVNVQARHSRAELPCQLLK